MVTLSRHVSNIEEARVSAKERRLLIGIVLTGLLLLEAVNTLAGLLIGGSRGALVCTVYGVMTAICLFLVWGLAICVMPEKWYYWTRDRWHQRCCIWWRIPYQPLPIQRAKTHPTDSLLENHVPVTRSDVVVIRSMTPESFNLLVTQHHLRPPVTGKE